MEREQLANTKKRYQRTKELARFSKIKQGWYRKGGETYKLYGKHWSSMMRELKTLKKILKEHGEEV